MNKKTNTLIRISLLVSLAAFIIVGCGGKAPIFTLTPPSPTVVHPSVLPSPQGSTPATLPYAHFAPSKDFGIYLEFDYPGSWSFSKQKRDAGLMIIGLDDPRFRSLPTPAPDDFHPTPNDYGRVDIWVWPVKPNQTLDTLIELYKRGHNENTWITPLDEYQTTIVGYDARVLEYQIDFPEEYTSLMFERSIFFAVSDQIYQITLVIAEKDRGGEFEKGYEYFLDSISITP